MDIDNKHRKASWEAIAKEFQSERDALKQTIFRLTEKYELEAELQAHRLQQAWDKIKFYEARGQYPREWYVKRSITTPDGSFIGCYKSVEEYAESLDSAES